VAAVSSGNHAQAVALAAKLHGIPATIVMPKDAPRVKLDATASHGAEIVYYDRYAEDRERIFRDLVASRNLHPIHPFDDARVIAGQGTVGLELLEDGGALDALVVPVSGGGLISGCATAAKALLPGIRIVGVEPEAGDDVARSLAAGERVSVPVPRTIADALQATSPGELTFTIIRDLVDEVVTVSDEEIVAAMRASREHLGLVAEPSGAVGLAAVLSGRAGVEGRRAAVVLSGGNVDPERFQRLLEGASSGAYPFPRGATS
jgi:threo-3-hydroxy-L-aspartate ammonia-lyase